MTPGLQWVSLLLLTRIGWAGRHWALPFLTALVVSARYDRRKGRRHKTVTDYAQQMLVCLRRWLRTGTWWWWPMAATPSASSCGIARVCQSRLSSSPTAQGRVPVPARATAAARPDRAAPAGRRAIAQPHGGAGRSRYTMDSLPRHRFRRQYAMVEPRFGRGAVVPRRAAAPSHTLGRHQIPGGAPRAPMLCYAPTPRRNPCGYCSGICCGGRSR